MSFEHRERRHSFEEAAEIFPGMIKTEAICQNVGLMAARVPDTRVNAARGARERAPATGSSARTREKGREGEGRGGKQEVR